ncbi:MAG: hypothetical protein AVDCRST_MAG61-3252, partial [uncultured Friedmanniella sp.]
GRAGHGTQSLQPRGAGRGGAGRGRRRRRRSRPSHRRRPGLHRPAAPRRRRGHRLPARSAGPRPGHPAVGRGRRPRRASPPGRHSLRLPGAQCGPLSGLRGGGTDAHRAGEAGRPGPARGRLCRPAGRGDRHLRAGNDGARRDEPAGQGGGLRRGPTGAGRGRAVRPLRAGPDRPGRAQLPAALGQRRFLLVRRRPRDPHRDAGSGRLLRRADRGTARDRAPAGVDGSAAQSRDRVRARLRGANSQRHRRHPERTARPGGGTGPGGL